MASDEIVIVEEVAPKDSGELREVGEEDWIDVDKVGQCDGFNLLDISNVRTVSEGEGGSDLEVQYDGLHSEPPTSRSLAGDLLEAEMAGDEALAATYSDHSIELSSDEEEADREVVLALMKRPPVTVECHDILDSDEEFPVCVEDKDKAGNVNIEEKRGHVQEYIEIEGAGVLFSKEFGLVLFHLDHVWINGEKLPSGESRSLLPPGTCLNFYDQSFCGEHYRRLSTQGVFHQAIVAWQGERPQHLMKKMSLLDSAYILSLETERNSFLLYLRGEVFVRAALVKVKGTVVGYLTGHLGIVEVRDQSGEKRNVFFHVDDVRVFRKPLLVYGGSPGYLLPAGLHVSVDAREVHIPGQEGAVQYQAVVVLAGPWPLAPCPSLLPGGDGSYSPTFETPDEQQHTFYYLELQLEARLGRQLRHFKELLAATEGRLEFDWREVAEVRSAEDREAWRDQFVAGHKRRHREVGQRGAWQKKQVEAVFKMPPVRKVKTLVKEEKWETDSEAATAGTLSPSRMSGISSGSAMSRPHSALSQHSMKSGGSSMSRMSALSKRSWYGPFPGCLTIKKEVKQESEVDGEGEGGPSWTSKRTRPVR